ncbi:hypothetical protein OQJ18_11580 [Fluoribacter dumoffii]|uniref:V8-like Glu-specific endopeptidase n=1 Tax=Fluoribacter dumoffii TaxID=463 RepID=A0A377G5Q6_9GAMM|nr:hypothetical protein [Fluoribacter dumoffii]KTC91647.1 hypothetical protein Ldum_2715 [Fluoribacter dumoffii NY 23]MCW8387228.1 hypothetical protein [Fluoribacter dumoffii]MCW8417266.1 hypothetical protein [Fluoribacter dumoffii]MCW8454893.1 hypothetical protein [Fluoribacter dumoffii]MCW8461030.1 hypothetical protein [Fluoribacter dumoffii]
MKKMLKLCSFVLLSLGVFPVFAAEENTGVENNQSHNAILNYWTPERLNNAKEMPLPQIQPNQHEEIQINNLNTKPEYQEGQPPDETIHPTPEVLIPQSLLQLKEKQIPQRQEFFDRGKSGANYTSSRLIPLTADLQYPYKAIGKLFFTIPGEGDFVCSASTIRQRIVLTAGHCVHAGFGGNAGYFTNFLFVPAYRDGVAPFGAWTWSYVRASNAWIVGAGDVPNSADYAMIEMADKVINGVTTRIGAVTGLLAWLTPSPVANHAHLIGYPCNLDNCEKMHQVTSQSVRIVAPNNAEYGSDMGGGSSGGPWIQNFGAGAVGQVGGYNSYRNAVIGVTSYGYTDSMIRLQGSSLFDSRFTDLMKIVCPHKAGNCT